MAKASASCLADARNSFLTYLWRSDIVLDAASGYDETNAISEVSWVKVVWRKPDEGPTRMQCLRKIT